MTNKTLSGAGSDYPVYPYKFELNLNKLMTDCKGFDGVDVVSLSTAEGGKTSYDFKTCMVMYSPRFEERLDSDVLMHTVQQQISLQTSDEAVVTGKWVCLFIVCSCVTHACNSNHV